jgi:nitrogen fixation protein NifX
MLVAFTSSDGKTIDRHFGQTESFDVWEVNREQAVFCGTRTADAEALAREEDKSNARANLLADCKIVYTMQIGGPAAAKLVSRRIQPMKTNTETPITEVIDKLQEVLKGRPPPWLRKALGDPEPEVHECDGTCASGSCESDD